MVRSSDADASLELSGENDTELTDLVWPDRVVISWPVLPSHSRIVQSQDAYASLKPSAVNVTQDTPSVWPFRTARTGFQSISEPEMTSTFRTRSPPYMRNKAVLRGAKVSAES